VLKNVSYTDSRLSRRTWVRKTLTVSQFVIAQFFIIATLVVGKQIRYALNMDLGYKKEAIVFFNVPEDFRNPDNKKFVLREKLESVPGIEKISLAGAPPASSNFNVSTMKFIKDGKKIETSVEIKSVDTAYLGLYQMKLLAGRNLQQSDTLREFIVNEAYTKFLGFKNPADIIGKTLDRGNGGLPVVGVMADVHTKSLHEAIQPLILTSQKQNQNIIHIALPQTASTDTWKMTLGKVEKAYKKIYPEAPFEYRFFDESIAALYKKEQNAAGLLNWSAGLAIFISCLGLLGLVIFTTNQRVKEIGIRKVLGASVTQIVALLSKDFVKLVILAFIITIPVAWWAMHEWLNNFAYRTTVSWWVFAVCGASMLGIALLIMGLRTVSAALDNPVNSLRNE
jgi:putative ABC transport system permease protein